MMGVMVDFYTHYDDTLFDVPLVTNQSAMAGSLQFG